MRPAQKNPQITAAYLSIIGAAVISLISLSIGLISDSVTLLLDASGSIVTLFMAFFVRSAVKKIGNPPDSLFHFGYEKYEPFGGVLQNFAMIMTSVVGIKFAVQDIVHPEDITGYGIPALAAFISCVIAALLAFYMKSIARKEGSRLLDNSALHWFIDSGLSAGMCAGFLFGIFLRKTAYAKFTHYIDPVMAIILALIFIRLPIKKFAGNLLELLDAAPPRDTQERAGSIIKRYCSAGLAMQRIRMRKAGNKVFIDICFLAPRELTIKEAGEFTDRLENALSSELPGCDCIMHFKHN